jgi:hypothetical protein
MAALVVAHFPLVSVVLGCLADLIMCFCHGHTVQTCDFYKGFETRPVLTSSTLEACPVMHMMYRAYKQRMQMSSLNFLGSYCYPHR